MNRVFGRGGSTNMLSSSSAAAGSERDRYFPRSSPDSATVRPPMRWVASDVGLHRGQCGPHLVHQGQPHGVLRGRHLDQAVPALVAGRERLGEEGLEQEDLDATLLHPRDELVVLVLGALDPQDVVEEQGVVGGRRQPLETELRAVHHHLSQAPDL